LNQPIQVPAVPSPSEPLVADEEGKEDVVQQAAPLQPIPRQEGESATPVLLPQPSSISANPLPVTLPTIKPNDVFPTVPLLPTTSQQPTPTETFERKKTKRSSASQDKPMTTSLPPPCKPTQPDAPDSTAPSRPQRNVAAKSWKDGPVHLRDYLVFLSYVYPDDDSPTNDDRKDAAIKAVSEEIDNMMNIKVMKAVK